MLRKNKFSSKKLFYLSIIFIIAIIIGQHFLIKFSSKNVLFQKNQYDNPPGIGHFISEPYENVIKFKFSLPDIEQGSYAGIEIPVSKLQIGNEYNISMEVKDSYPHDWPGIEELRIIVDNNILWKYDPGKKKFSGWVPVNIIIKPETEEIKLKIELYVIGNPPKEAQWGLVGPYEIKNISLINTINGDKIDVSRNRIGSKMIFLGLKIINIFVFIFIIFAGINLIIVLIEIKNKKNITLEHILNSQLNNKLFIALALFIISFITKLLYYYYHQDLTTLTSIVGVPFSDARSWDTMSIGIAEGKGFLGWYSSFRPFYAILLAFFYTWFGHSFILAKLINIILSSLSVSFIYLIGEKVFNRTIGITVALITTFNVNILNDTLCITTEIAGLSFFIISCYYIIEGIDTKKIIYLFAGGVFFSLSNLTRTITLFVFPPYLIIILYILYKEKIILKKILYFISIFIFGVIITFLPWIIRQKLVYGIWTISSNSSSLLYAATSPEYKVWSGKEELEATQKGVIGIKERNDYFNKKAIDNIKKYPLFYLKNFLKSFYEFISYYNLYKKIYLLFIILLFLKFSLKIKERKKNVFLGIILFLILFFHFIIPESKLFLLCISGMLLSFIYSKNKYSLILTISLLFTGIGSALVANAGVINRLFVMVSWLFDFFYFYTYYFIVDIVYCKILANKQDLNCNNKIYNDNIYELFISKILKVLRNIIFIFLLISALKIIYLTYFIEHHGKNIDSNFTFHKKKEILYKLKNIISYDIFSDEEIEKETSYAKPVTYEEDGKNQGKIVFYFGKIDRYIYHFPKSKKYNHYLRLFKDRDYERTVFSSNISLSRGYNYFIFPGEIPYSLINRYVIIIGRLNVDINETFESRKFTEVIAICTVDKESYEEIMLSKNNSHIRIIQNLKNQIIDTGRK